MSRSLVIVESPAKAKTIKKYLGDGYIVESSVGHIRDLARPSDVDMAVRKENKYIAEYAVDVEKDFSPIYVVNPDKKSHVAALKKQLKQSDELLLATDEDREGESIAWHLLEVLKPKVPVRRMVFHEITKGAIQKAVEQTREIDQQLVYAQEARRILDRLYGFAMSNMARRKGRGRSAGRVQSVATRIVVERERERMAFRAASYWDLHGLFKTNPEFSAKLLELNGKRVAAGRDFGDDGKLLEKRKGAVIVLDETRTNDLAKALQGKTLEVSKVETKPFRRRPAPPFMTSTLQQEAGRKLGWGAQTTMRVAQRLYENGFITYMRTDSTTLSETALKAARDQIQERYTPRDLPETPRQYSRKVKNAQEAHEAIRPAGDVCRPVEALSSELSSQEAKLYDLIWKRTVASQMSDAEGESLIVQISGTTDSGDAVVFHVTGQTITFPGFLKAYVEGSDDPSAELESKDRPLPNMSVGQSMTAESFEAKHHETKPPARFTEASLVKELERLGVGRPSTYASIITVIQNRGYVWKRARALVPAFRAFQVVRLLEDHFGDLVDYQFTARMEDELDEIAAGKGDHIGYLRDFFFGAEAPGLEKRVEEKLESIDLDEVKRLETIPIGRAESGDEVFVRIGQYGPYLQTGEGDAKQTVSIPEDLAPDELTVERALELLAAPSGDRVLGTEPESGLPVLAKAGRFGAYVQLGELEKDSKEKPKTASLFKTMSLETLTLEQALQLLTLPREVGVAEDGEAIVAANGRYGPYITKGKENRSLETEEQLFTLTVPEALEILAKPKQRRGRGAPKPPLKELEEDPVSGQKIVVKEGRFGPYVTDGEVNASLRTADTVENITTERAAELLQARRDRIAAKGGKTTKKKSKKKTKKKATKKKATKKTAKKSTKKASKKSTKKATKKSTKKTTKKTAKKSTTPAEA